MEKKPEQIEDEIREELKEAAHYFGGRPDGFKKLREMIDEIEDAENEAAWERHCTNY